MVIATIARWAYKPTCSGAASQGSHVRSGSPDPRLAVLHGKT